MSSDTSIGKFSIFCGIWNLIMGFLSGFGFIFSSFDMGDEGYSKVGELYKQIAHNVSWFGMFLFVLGLISCILLIVGGVILLSDSEDTSVTGFGLVGVFFYFMCFIGMAFLLAISGGKLSNELSWITGFLLIMIPALSLRQMLKKT